MTGGGLLYRHDGRMRVYRCRDKRYARQCVREVERHGGGSIMMWAGISVNELSAEQSWCMSKGV